MAITPPPPQPASPGAWHSIRSFLGIGSFADWFFKQLCQSSALVILLLVALIVALLSIQAWPAVRKLGPEVFTAKSWDPNPRYDEEDEDKVVSYGSFAVWPFIYGSILTSVIGMIIAVPLGVGTAAFLSEIAPPSVKRGGSFLVELLAAIPSVVYGFWGVNFLAPWVQDVFTAMGGPNTAGKGLLSSGLILAIMVVPYVAAVSYDVLQAVPGAQRQGSLALGATRWQTIWRVVLPYGLPGITGGSFLALGRALGETMAVTMLIGNVPLIERLPYGRGYSIPSVLAQELSNANSDLHFSVLIEMGLMLFAVTILMNVLARLLIWQVGRPGGGLNFWRPMMRLFAGPSRPVVSSTAAEPEVGRGPRRPLGTPLIDPLIMNRVMTGVLGLCLVVTCVPLFLILGYILYRGVGALDVNFFVSLPKPMGEEGGGLANAIVGSGVIVGLASVISLPLGLLAAIFLAEYRTNRIGPVVRFFGELLNGVPSIVVGTFVYAFVQLLVYWHWLSPKGQFSGWAGVFALTIMMVPIVMRASEESLKLVPQALRNASHALGAHHWQTVLRVSVPAALPAIITGAFLAIARIAGETAPLLMTAFGNDKMALNPADKMGFLPLYIFRYSMSGNEIWEKQAWAAALVLLTFVMLLNVGIRFLTGKRVVLASRAE